MDERSAYATEVIMKKMDVRDYQLFLYWLDITWGRSYIVAWWYDNSVRRKATARVDVSDTPMIMFDGLVIKSL